MDFRKVTPDSINSKCFCLLKETTTTRATTTTTTTTTPSPQAWPKEEETEDFFQKYAPFIYALAGFLLFSMFLCLLFRCFKVVKEYERIVIFRLGRVRTGLARGPGIVFILPYVDTFKKVDLRTMSYDVPPQEILTKDSVSVAVDAVMFYSIKDPLKSVVAVEDCSASTRFLAATTLRNVLGTRDLKQVLTDREAISHSMQTTLDEATDPWGVDVERVETKNVWLPMELQRSMAAEAEANREARAKVVAAKGEIIACRALKEASNIMIDNPMALQLRYLQSLNNISNEKNSTILFPFPIDFLSPFLEIPGSGGLSSLKAQGGNTEEARGGNIEEARCGNIKEARGGNTEEDRGGNIKEARGGNTEEDRGGNTKEDRGGKTEEARCGNIKEARGGNTEEDRGGNTEEAWGGNTEESRGGNTEDASSGRGTCCNMDIRKGCQKNII